MRRQISSIISSGRGVWRDRRGVAAPLVAVSAVVLFGVAGLAVDVGAALATRNALQASTDAAAMAGAQDINCATCTASQPVTTATAYSAVAGGKNVRSGITATMVAGYPAVRCFTSTGITCAGPSGGNAIVVKQQASVPTTFARVLGINSFNVTTTATASAAGGISKPLHVMLVLDTTRSMGTTPDPNCGVSGATRLTCALMGIQIIETTLAPSVDQIGLMVFPGLTNASQVQYDTNCSGTSPAIAPYGSTPAPVYQIVPLSTDYRTSDTSKTLNPSSALAKASSTSTQGAAGCNNGVQAPGGMGTYFAEAITAAQAALAASAQPNTQNVIILLSDGAANASSPTQITAALGTNECHAAITAARAAGAAGTWVYSLAYGATTATTDCSKDTGSNAITPCATMQQIASDPTKFYSDNITACTSANSSLVGLLATFGAIAQSLLPPRMLPDNTT